MQRGVVGICTKADHRTNFDLQVDKISKICDITVVT